MAAADVVEIVPVFTQPSPRVRQVRMDAPWAWLAAGWRDLMGAPGVGLAYGAVFAAMGAAVTLGAFAAGVPHVILPLAAGFMLLGPILAAGLYDTSRRREKGLPVSLAQAFGAWRLNRTQIAFMGVALMLVFLFWIRIATLLFALFFSKAPPSLDQLIQATFLSADALPFLLVGSAIGAGMAAFVFAISVVAVPMLLDRPVSVLTAIATSLTAVKLNLRPMAVWAALIALFTGVGLVTFYIGLVVTLPLIAHATWHAYKDVVVPDDAGGGAPAYTP